MRRMPKIKHFITALAAFLMLLGVTVTAYGDAASPSFTYSYPVDGVRFRLYQVGEIQQDAYVLTGEFAGYDVNLEDKAAGETLAAYVERDQLQPVAEAVSQDGMLKFEDLQQKIYLMTGETTIEDRVKWIPSAVLFSVPQADTETGELIWDITAGGKYTREELPPLVDISVEKIWKDTGYEKKRPASIKAQLLKDGQVYDTVELGKTNNWKHTWEKLDPEFTWTVVEEKVPDHYKVTIRNEKGVFVLENVYENGQTTPTPTPPNPNIPNTGQLWWPVGILAVVGIGLILVGLIRRKRSE
ncbi:MAG: Cna B-type domain-containing protein [Lachnospiraceae bacterium]|nr:Cna B-type domain-containing protein [Lachnospiraceae bacterium]